MQGITPTLATHHLSQYCEDDICSNLLAPLEVGNIVLSHRAVAAPLTRCRALNYAPQEAHQEYYGQRATKGGLLITEAVAISQEGIGFPHSPGIWTEEQVQQWRHVVRAVHDKGGYIFCQLWHVGRASHTYYQPHGDAEGLLNGPVSSTARKVPESRQIRLPDGVMAEYSQPRALDMHEIPKVVEQFQHGARNAMRAGFDGVEIHGAHGYLIDQFLKDGINNREDEYGGSVENRCRFALEVMSAVVSEIGGPKTAMRISPIIDHLGAYDSDPIPLGLHLISHLNNMDLAYLHITEPRMTNQGLKPITTNAGDEERSLQLFQKAYKGRVMLSGGYTRETGMEAIRSGAADMISYGRLFIANPDLPLRFAIRAELNEGDRSTYYTHDQVKGYLDYAMLTPSQVAQRWADMKADMGKKKMVEWNYLITSQQSSRHVWLESPAESNTGTPQSKSMFLQKPTLSSKKTP
ncbi:hypothetical protein GOP47_0018673 [Adiantum capillus-veneris]|uniref:NADH:flavin oxidoreductase/NADH oxidase N-terminal domain-containing protein n=1 Tax=Adiantum capillus-veneris TaxID=13818 RepID=A0A9D4UDM8_ADICA|nr:hypothetical protein GOP47_0018673 [Adiantum capillus-veneris]